MRRNFLRVAAILLSFFASCRAHDLTFDTSYSVLDITSDKLQWVLTFNFYDLDKAFHLDTDRDRILSLEEIRKGIPEIAEYLRAHIEVIADWRRQELTLSPVLVLTKNADLITKDAYVLDDLKKTPMTPIEDTQRFQFNFVFVCDLDKVPTSLSIKEDFFSHLSPWHKNLLKADFPNETKQAVLIAEANSARFTTGEDMPWVHLILQFVHLGIEHILTGYDHILFLFALLLVSGRFLNLIKIITAFTIAHSISLIIVTLNSVNVPSRFTESAIALTIVYVAIENFFVKESGKRWRLTFAFGLIHGFGFATVLKELGLPRQGLVTSLLAFNVGVELGQLMIVSLFFPILWYFGKKAWYVWIVRIGSALILGCGLAWFIRRAFGIALGPF